MSSRDVNAEQVRGEHLAEVNEPAHWIYLFAVLLGGIVLMVAFIAVLGTASS
jgi:hypothetical protein